MSAFCRLALIPAIVTGWLLTAGSALALTPQVKDDAGFFSADAVKKANAIIRDIENQFKKDLVIETYMTVPAGKIKEASDKGSRGPFFHDWAVQQAKAAQVQGIYVLVTKTPGHVEVAVGDKTEKEGFFTSAEGKILRDKMAARFRDKQYDQGLQDGVQFVRDTLSSQVKHRGGAPAAGGGVAGAHQRGFNWAELICPAIVILGVIWLVFGLIRAFAGMGARGGYGGGGYGPGYGGGGGGGFMSGLMGGLFGAMAGNWLYHSMFGGHSYGGGWDSSASGTDAGSSGMDQDYTTSGSDFGDGGGGDVGDSGGGGDFGGGGGDF
jgi:hypothetical protein